MWEALRAPIPYSFAKSHLVHNGIGKTCYLHTAAAFRDYEWATTSRRHSA